MAAIDLIIPEIWRDEPRVRAAFTLKNEGFRHGGRVPGLNLAVSTDEDPEVVMSNRAALFAELGLSDADVARGRQVHGNTVHVVGHGGIHPDGDGFVTSTPGVAVSVLVADCAAIFVSDAEAGVVGALHAGWRGTVAGIVGKGVEAMRSLGAEPARIKAFVGPCITFGAFEIGEEVADQFPARFVDRTSFDKPRADIKGWLAEQLGDAGVLSENIEVHPGCTLTETGYHSFRRDKERSGRMMALIWMP